MYMVGMPQIIYSAGAQLRLSGRYWRPPPFSAVLQQQPLPRSSPSATQDKLWDKPGQRVAVTHRLFHPSDKRSSPRSLYHSPGSLARRVAEDTVLKKMERKMSDPPMLLLPMNATAQNKKTEQRASKKALEMIVLDGFGHPVQENMLDRCDRTLSKLPHPNAG